MSNLYESGSPVTCSGEEVTINANIVRVVYKNTYPDPRALEFFAEAGVEVVEA